MLYVGTTDDLYRRIAEHKKGTIEGFTKKYHVYKLVWYEEFANPLDAIAGEKKIKGRSRWKKVQRKQAKNHTWKDLSVE